MSEVANRLVRFTRDPAYRTRVRDVGKLFVRYPRAFGYKGAALLINRGHRAAEYFHNHQSVRCSICGWSGNAFRAFGTFGYMRRNARCPSCGSLERHRAMIEFLVREGWITRSKSCLDVGGIPPFAPWFKAHDVKYVSMSLGDPASVCMNIERLGFADESFDLILDSHVLEYVDDYRRALSELWRVLQRGGRMLLTEAYVYGQPRTIEFGEPNPAATFMVRRFGDDLLHTLTDSGFRVRRWDHLGHNDRPGDYFFLCEKARET
jgi:SAM-dependent methyltransferase